MLVLNTILKSKILKNCRIFVLLFIVTACSSYEQVEFKEKTDLSKYFYIQLSSMVHIPYCGGGYPSPDKELPLNKFITKNGCENANQAISDSSCF